MEKQGFWKSLSSSNRYVAGNLFFLYFVQGIFVIMIGSILPMMKKEYGLDYQVGGMLISAHSIGTIAISMVAGLVPFFWGIKKSLLFLNLFTFVGFAMMLISGNPIWLIVALLFTGIGRGSVSIYNNSIINVLSNGHAGPLNLLHSFFSIGAIISPFIVLLCALTGNSGWRIAAIVVIVLGVLSTITSVKMEIENDIPKKANSDVTPFGFFKEKIFWITAGIMFFHLCLQGTFDGWMVTYFVDTKTMDLSTAQILNAVLWVVILGGRLGCAVLSNYYKTSKIILISAIGITTFYIFLILSQGPIAMGVASVGLGLCLSGMYGTTIANAGEVLQKYPLAMGIFITITGVGSMIVPTIIGTIAETSGIRSGLGSVIVAAISLLGFALWNVFAYNRRTVIKQEQLEY